MMDTWTWDGLISRLTSFHHWKIQTQNSAKRRKYYECTIRHNHHVYSAYARTPADAVRRAIERLEAGGTAKFKVVR